MLPTLALALALTGPVETGLSTLADDLTAAIALRFPVVDGRVLRVDGETTFVDVPGLPAGTVLEWLVPDASFTDPISLEVVGEVLRPCGVIQIDGSTGLASYGRASPTGDCPGRGIRIGALVRDPSGPIRLAVQQGEAEPSVAGLLEVLIAILPGRLSRTGRFDARAHALAPAPHIAEPDLDGRLAAARLDGIVIISSARRGGRLLLLAEIAARAPRTLRDIIQLEAPSVPEALWRERGRSVASPYGSASVAIEGEVLDLAVVELDDGVAVAVLTDRGLSLAVADGQGETLALTELVPLTELPRRPCRVARGTVSQLDPGLCFAMSRLGHGYCLDLTTRRLTRVDGVPIPGFDGLLLARYRDGTGELTGVLRDAVGRQLADIGPFLGLAGDPDRFGLYVKRLDGVLGQLRSLADRVVPLGGVAGDAWTVLGPELRIETAPAVPGQPDELRWVRGAEVTRRRSVAGSIAAVAAADLDGDGAPELAVATAEPDGPSRLTIYPAR